MGVGTSQLDAITKNHRGSSWLLLDVEFVSHLNPPMFHVKH
jgi:hypothetical protein